jgi:hypothetical protein
VRSSGRALKGGNFICDGSFSPVQDLTPHPLGPSCAAPRVPLGSGSVGLADGYCGVADYLLWTQPGSYICRRSSAPPDKPSSCGDEFLVSGRFAAQ